MSNSNSYLDDNRLPWEEPFNLNSEATSKELADNDESLHLEDTIPATELDDLNYSGDGWDLMVFYYNQGLSLTWGRAVPETINGILYKEKTPISKTWSSEPEKRLSLDALAKVMASAARGLKIAPIIICGKGSGNLWVIDIDIKHWPGIDVRYFNAIRETNPELWKKLRIHKTPSGGYHIIYRIEIFVPGGNVKLAYKENEKEAGIETRAHGGYIMAPPGMGYSIFKLPEEGDSFPTISVEEHEFLINLAKLYNERKKKVVFRSTRKFEDIYDENPFKHFNRSRAAAEILLNHGWVVEKETLQWIHFTRPGKNRGISASYNKEDNFFHFFTTSTEFDGDKTYDPTAVRCKLEFDDDYKKMYPVLVKEGYGRYNAKYEVRMVKKAAETNKALPPNSSDEAKEQYQNAIEEYSIKYPFGAFWEPKENDGYTISRLALTNVVTSLGFSLLRGEIVRIERPYFDRIKDERAVYDILKEYIKEEDVKEYEEIVNAFDAFWQYNGKYIITRIPILDENEILKSTESISYTVYKNVILVINNNITEISPDSINKLIDRSVIINRTWEGLTDWSSCKYVDFLNKAVNIDIHELQKIIGYLCFDFNDETQPWIPVLLDENNSEDGGGTGKGLFCQLLKPCTTVKTIDLDEKFTKKSEILQSWNGERLVHVNDLSKNFDLKRFKALSTEGTERKLLYKNLDTIPPEEMPKFIISTQWGVDLFTDGGVKRRVIPIPFTKYFHQKRTPKDEYGGKIPHVWTNEDWRGYDSFIAEGIRNFLSDKNLDPSLIYNEVTWKNNFNQTFDSGEDNLLVWITTNIKTWACDQFYGRGAMNKELIFLYNEFCKKEEIKPTHSIQELRKAIKSYCDHYGIPVEMDREVRENQFNRGRGIIIECFS